MNDHVFVMYNLKLGQRYTKRSSSIQAHLCLDDLPVDNEWITKQEALTLPTTLNWLCVLDSEDRKEARETSESEDHGGVHVNTVRNVSEENVYEISDDDNDVEEVGAIQAQQELVPII